MMLVFNKLALILGGGSFLVSVIVAKGMGWTPDGPQGTYFLVLSGALLGLIDLALRLRHIKDIHAPPAPTIITRQGPVPTRPEPVMKVLNVFLSGEKGAQFFWVLPGWALGAFMAYAGITEVLGAK